MTLEKARTGLFILLINYPDAMIVKYDAQIYDEQPSGTPGTPGWWARKPDGPWVCVDLDNGEKFAIWKETGNVFRVDENGAVEDEPLYEASSIISWGPDQDA